MNELEEIISLSKAQWQGILEYVENTDPKDLSKDRNGFFIFHNIKAKASPQVKGLRSRCWFCDYTLPHSCMQSCPLAHITGHICTRPGNIYYELTNPIVEKGDLLSHIKALLSLLLKIRIVFSTEEELIFSFENEFFFYKRKAFHVSDKVIWKFALVKRETSCMPKDPIEAFQKTLQSWKKVYSYIKKTRLKDLPELIDVKGNPKFDISRIKALADPAVKKQKGFCYLCSYAYGVGDSLACCIHRCIVTKLVGKSCASLALSHTNLSNHKISTKKELLKRTRAVIKTLEEVKFAPLIKHREGDIVSCTYQDTHYLILFPHNTVKPAKILYKVYIGMKEDLICE